MADASPVTLADIKQPIEYIVVVFGVYNDFIQAVEHGSCFGVDTTAGEEERGICWHSPGGIAVVDEA